MRDRSTDERVKRSGEKIEKNWAENGALGNSVRMRDEAEMCGGGYGRCAG